MVVQVLPRDLAQLGRAGKRQGDPKTAVLVPGFLERRAIELLDVTVEQRREQPAAEVLDALRFGRLDPALALPRPADLEHEDLELHVAERRLEATEGLAGRSRRDHPVRARGLPAIDA